MSGGFAGTCLIAYVQPDVGRASPLRSALFSSLYAIPGRLIASQSGRIVEAARAG
jgi:PAT family beta-lactamase induction signal transducer AmpG